MLEGEVKMWLKNLWQAMSGISDKAVRAHSGYNGFEMTLDAGCIARMGAVNPINVAWWSDGDFSATGVVRRIDQGEATLILSSEPQYNQTIKLQFLERTLSLFGALNLICSRCGAASCRLHVADLEGLCLKCATFGDKKHTYSSEERCIVEAAAMYGYRRLAGSTPSTEVRQVYWSTVVVYSVNPVALRGDQVQKGLVYFRQ